MRAVALLTAFAWGGAVLTSHGSAHARDLSVCVDKASPTAAADRRIAGAVASAEQASLAEYDFTSTDDEDGYDAGDFKRLLKQKCSLVIGFPADPALAALPAGLAKTRPYASTGFVLVTRSGVTADSLAALPDGQEVGVTYGSIPDVILVQQHGGLKPNLFPTEKETLAALRSGEVKVALLWRPTLGALDPASGFTVHPLTEAHAHWDLVALYLKTKADDGTAFDAAIDSLRKSGSLATLLAPLGIENETAPPDHADAAPPAMAPRIIPAVYVPSGEPPALYTAAQADEGEKKFAEKCSMCHGAALEGMAGPALTGPNFASVKADFKVRDVFMIVSQNMPATQPGSLSHDDYTQIMAFLLRRNGYPAGSTVLTFDSALSSDVPLRYHPK